MRYIQQKKDFIPALEGMRALAVLAVLLFHLDFTIFQGGFLGVDLFFVISGYIITRNLLSDYEQKRFSFPDFYRRRYRRLIPALIATILLTMIIATTIVPPEELALTARSALFSLFSLGNFNFWLESGYFDNSAATKPLLHTWSLSVEEQFYLIWPAILILIAGTRYRIWLPLGLLFGSAALSLYLSASMPDAVFYLLPFRIHQFMAGAIIAICGLSIAGRLGTLINGLAGIILVSSFFVVSDQTSPFISAALVSIVGWLLICTRLSPFAYWVYGNPFMQWIGTRSYALYLTHWPLIVLYKYKQGFELTIISQVGLAIGSVLSAIALHELVEKPFRLRGPDNTSLKRHAFSITSAAMLLTTVMAISLWQLDVLPKQASSEISTLAVKAKQGSTQRYFRVRVNTCHLTPDSSIANYNMKACAGQSRGRPNILVIGDSLAADIYMMLTETYPDIDVSQATAAGCPPLLRQRSGIYRTCQQLNTLRFSDDFLRDRDLVVLAADWRTEQFSALQETVELLANRDKKILVFGPRIKFLEKSDLLIQQQKSVEGINERISPLADRREGILQGMRDSLPKTPVIDLISLQCQPLCDLIIDGEVVYADRHHLTLMGARLMGKRFDEAHSIKQYLTQKIADPRPSPRTGDDL